MIARFLLLLLYVFACLVIGVVVSGCGVLLVVGNFGGPLSASALAIGYGLIFLGLC